MSPRRRTLRARVAAAVCYRVRRGGRVQFLLVRTSDGSKWTLPKGHVNRGERMWQAAAREAREEAGVGGIVERRALTTYVYPTRLRRLGEFGDATVAAFLIAVLAQGLRHERGRTPTWFSRTSAARRFAVGGRQRRHVREQARVLRTAESAIKSLLSWR